MKRYEITKEIIDDLLLYDGKTGIFKWRVDRRQKKSGDVAGYTCPQGYVQIRINGVLYRAHTLAWISVHGKFPDEVIDHIDGNKSNNRIDNLRDCSQKVNLQNMRKSYGASKFVGVSWFEQTKKWRAQILSTDGKRVFLGSFNCEIQAMDAYLEAKKLFHK